MLSWSGVNSPPNVPPLLSSPSRLPFPIRDVPRIIGHRSVLEQHLLRRVQERDEKDVE